MKVEMYTKAFCPFCIRAKMLLNAKKVKNIMEYRVDKKPQLLSEMLSRSNNNRTVPQIFINGYYVGGFDELNALNKKKKLDDLLKATEKKG